MPRTTTATEHKKPWPATVRHPQQAGCHSNPATRDGGMSGLGSEPAVLRTVCVLTRGGCSTFNKTPPHGHKTHLHITNGASHGGGGGQRRGEVMHQRCSLRTNAAPLGTCVKHWNEIKAWILDALSIGLLEELSHGKQCHGLFSLPDCAHFATDFHQRFEISSRKLK